jgi:hypothetical protein
MEATLMKLKSHIVFMLFFISFIGSFSLLSVDIADAGNCQIVRVAKETRGDESLIYLYPDEIKVPKGTCVVWVNWAEREKVSINFHKNSRSCMVATEAPSGFVLVESCFLTDFLDIGQTVSLRFKEAGVFTYQLEILGEKINDSGGKDRIIAREGKIVVE